MKKLLNVVLIVIISIIVSCKYPNVKEAIDDSKPTPTPAPNPPAPKPPIPNPNPSETPKITLDDLISAFEIKKGDMPASMMAKKIRDENAKPESKIEFTKKEIVCYDDKNATFTMHFEGKKIKADSTEEKFDNDVLFTEFIHPLKDKVVQSVNVDDFELSLDEGIENNYSLDKYIEELNKNIENKRMLKKLAFTLSDSTTVIELGMHEKYILKATARKAKDNKIQIVPKVPYFRLDKGEIMEIEEDESVVSFTTLTQQLTKGYFDEKDVFRYVLNKVAGDSTIKADSSVFASSFYAFAKFTNTTPNNIFSDEFRDAVKVYQDRYRGGGEGKHLNLDIEYGINQPKNGGIEADDYKGALKINLCIATSTQIADQNNIIATKLIEKSSGFASIFDDAALEKQEHLVFRLITKVPALNESQKQNWLNRSLNKVALLRVSETGTSTVNTNFFKSNADIVLSVNGSSTNLETLGCGNFGASKTKHNKDILIEYIQLNKKKGSKDMEILVTLKGDREEPLKIVVAPYE